MSCEYDDEDDMRDELYEYLYGEKKNNKKDENPMKKHWKIEGSIDHYTTYDLAETAAKRKMAGSRNLEDWKIYEYVARVVSPVPTFEVEKV